MKKLIINLSDSDYEKFRFEAIHEKKSIESIIRERIMSKPFCNEVEEAFDEFMEKEMQNIIGG